MHLVVIADDITGAFDTGVQFAKRGAQVKIFRNTSLSHTFEGLQHIRLSGSAVTVIDTETRHLSPKEAERVMTELTSFVLEQGATHLYVKTDSGLRGNVGATLSAVLKASGFPFLAFVPAYPAMDRITVGGVQYISGVPLRDSVFANDSFEPVTADSIADLFASCGVCVRHFTPDDEGPFAAEHPSVGIFDASRDADLERIAETLKRQNLLKLTAGCAAFAASLAGALGFCHPSAASDSAPAKPLAVVCGSLNDITAKQVEWAVEHQARRISLDARQLLDSDWFTEDKGQAWLEELRRSLDGKRTVIFDTARMARPEDFDLAKQEGVHRADIGRRIAGNLGQLTNCLLHEPETSAYNMMIIGGDTLMGFFQNFDRGNITLIGEPMPGVVHFRMDDGSRVYNMLSKSGGFGKKTLLTDLAGQG